MIKIKLNDKIKKQILDKRNSEPTKIGSVVSIDKYTFTVKYENGFRESFTVADIINPQDYNLSIKKGKEWVKMEIKQDKGDR